MTMHLLPAAIGALTAIRPAKPECREGYRDIGTTPASFLIRHPGLVSGASSPHALGDRCLRGLVASSLCMRRLCVLPAHLGWGVGWIPKRNSAFLFVPFMFHAFR